MLAEPVPISGGIAGMVGRSITLDGQHITAGFARGFGDDIDAILRWAKLGYEPQPASFQRILDVLLEIVGSDGAKSCITQALATTGCVLKVARISHVQ